MLKKASVNEVIQLQKSREVERSEGLSGTESTEWSFMKKEAFFTAKGNLKVFLGDQFSIKQEEVCRI